MCGYQPESQMLELWSSHRRRMVYTVQPANRPLAGKERSALKRYLVAIPVMAGLIALLSGCVVEPYRHGGYYGGGYGHSQGYGYGNRGYGGYNQYGGGWHGHRHHHDDDD